MSCFYNNYYRQNTSVTKAEYSYNGGPILDEYRPSKIKKKTEKTAFLIDVSAIPSL